MRILVVSQSFHPEVAAAPIRLKNMVDSLQEKGNIVDVLTAMPNYPTGRIFDGYRGRFFIKNDNGNGSIYRYWIYANNSFNKYKRMFGMMSFALTLRCFGFKRSLIKSYDYIIVQTPPLIVAWSTVKMLRRRCKGKIVLNVSDIHPLALVHEGHLKEGSKFHKIMLRMEKYLYEKSDALMGQSEEILKFVNGKREMKSFLYRTLQKSSTTSEEYQIPEKTSHNRLVYAGLLSKTQGVLSIIENVDFKSLGIEFHIFGDGNQREDIEKMCDNSSLFYHGVVSSEQIMVELKKYDASIISLSFDSTGAVPSKIYNVVYAGLPVMYMGMIKGEASQLIQKYRIGFVADTNDFAALRENLLRFRDLTNSEYMEMVDHCRALTNNDFNYENQMCRFDEFLKGL